MKQATMTIDSAYAIDRVDARIYGSFVEHLGRAIYGGVYEPGHATADEQGFRRDVIARARELGVTVVRYPGGNFVSGFRWEDSVGPVDKRPKRLDLAWSSTEPNTVGLHEFHDWCGKAGAELMYSVNLGTRGPEEARDVVEYANHASGSHFSDLRIRNGCREPLGIKLWCLGNEMDGPWQMGQKTAREYGRAANEAAKMMKYVDPSIELVACGSSHSEMPTFGDWELTMLEECYENVDYVSLHRYYANHTGDTASFLARALDLDDFIRTVAAICDAVKGKKRAKKRLNLSFDEWNVWYHSLGQDKEVLRNNRWGTGLPLLEDVYNFEDALLCGSMLLTFLRNADRVKIACMAQLVNAIAPIMTRTGGCCWAQTTFWPLCHTARYGRGTSVRLALESPAYDCADFERVPVLDAAATIDDEGNLSLFVVNRDLSEDCPLAVDLRSFGELRGVEHILLHHGDVGACNTEDRPNAVIPTSRRLDRAMDGGRASLTVPRLSWNVFRFARG